MTSPGTLFLIAGSRSLGRDARGYRWACDHITVSLLGNPGAVVLTGGAEGPDVWAEDLGLRYGHRVVVYRPDGTRRDLTSYTGAPLVTRWGNPPAGAGAPLARNRAMAQRAARAASQGWRVEVLGFVDLGSKSRGTDHCLGAATGEGLTVRRFTWGQAPAAPAAEGAAA